MRGAGAYGARRSVEWAKRSLSYLTAGDARAETGQTLLLIHGSGMSARSWAGQLRGLAHGLRMLAIDLPGHGESDALPEATDERYAETACALLDALKTGAVFVAGHSLGGAVALSLAARRPDLVQGLILLSTCAKLPEPAGSPERVLYWFLPGFLRKLVFFSTAKKMLFAPGAPSWAIRLGVEELRACRPETILQDVAAAKAMDLEEEARGLRVPTLILCGSRDKLTPPALSQRLYDFIPGSRLDIVEGAGHMLPVEAAERVNRAILEFVSSVARAQVPRPLPIEGAATSTFLRRLLKAFFPSASRRPGGRR